MQNVSATVPTFATPIPANKATAISVVAIHTVTVLAFAHTHTTPVRDTHIIPTSTIPQ